MRKKSTSATGTPPKRFPEKKLVVIALPFLSEGEIPLVQGIREPLEQQGELEVMVLSGGYEAPLRRLAETGQLAGAIGEFVSGRWLESLLAQHIRIVQIGSSVQARAMIPSVATDLGAMAEEAVQVFLGAGIQGVAYLGPARVLGPIAQETVAPLHLEKALTEACLRHAIEITHCSAMSGALVKNFLQTLPHPTGLLCATDRLARIAILAAREAGLRIPHDLAILGVGNSRMESLSAQCAISSFELPLEAIGKQAAALMITLLEGKPGEGRALLPARLHERESSMRASSGVARALAYLRSHPESSITAGELARLVGMSRRSLETAMKLATGSSPGRTLQQRRRMRAEQLLQQTDLSIAAVGEACGYREGAVFSTAFRRWTGQSPREFRRSKMRAIKKLTQS
jgi:LacI family transcriptional regulator